MWGYFSPQETGTLSFMWWRQDAQLAPSLRSPMASPYLPTFESLGHGLSLSGKARTALPVNLEERQQAGGHGTALQPERGSSWKRSPIFTRTKLCRWSFALCTPPWIGAGQRRKRHIVCVCPGTWCDNCSPAKPPFSCVEWCCCKGTLWDSFQYC